MIHGQQSLFPELDRSTAVETKKPVGTNASVEDGGVLAQPVVTSAQEVLGRIAAKLQSSVHQEQHPVPSRVDISQRAMTAPGAADHAALGPVPKDLIR